MLPVSPISSRHLKNEFEIFLCVKMYNFFFLIVKPRITLAPTPSILNLGVVRTAVVVFPEFCGSAGGWAEAI